MANPIYHDDPSWYERPGETVLLHVDQKPTVFAMGGAVWEKPRRLAVMSAQADLTHCACCNRLHREVGLLCPYCSRAQANDETALARARQPQPSGPRIHGLREGWER